MLCLKKLQRSLSEGYSFENLKNVLLTVLVGVFLAHGLGVQALVNKPQHVA